MPGFAVIREEQYTATSDTQCIQVIIPAGDEYKHLLNGMLTLPGNVANYADPLSVQAEGVAAAWNDAIALIDWENCMEPSEIFSSRIVLWGAEMTVTHGNAYAWNSNNSQWLNGVWRQAAAAINDESQAHFAVPRGIYRLDFVGMKSSICGQQQITWNGTAFPAVIDWYNSTTVVNQTVQPGYDITLNDDAGLTINSKMTGKNASATDYQLMLSWMKIRRTGDV